MSNQWTDRWNERYKAQDFAYGKTPNNFLKEQIQEFEPGKILFPAEGEGRNAVFAATLGWNVDAFDISHEGKKKADLLAHEMNVNIDYKVGNLVDLNYKDESFDAIALIYAHFPANIKSELHQQLIQKLKKGGIVIFEAFSKSHLDYVMKDEKVGGPKDIDALFSIEEIESDFNHFEMLYLEELVILLNEGLYHNGTGSVIRFVGRKL